MRDTLGFLMTREVAHQKSFEKAPYSIKPNCPPGRIPADATVRARAGREAAQFAGVMGSLVSPKWLQGLAWLSTALILLMNGVLLLEAL